MRAYLKGTVAEWLGGGLQNLIQRFESARYLSFLTGDEILNLSPVFFVYTSGVDQTGITEKRMPGKFICNFQFFFDVLNVH